jgi:membrane protein
MRRFGAIVKRTAVSFYDDQMTQHAAALTYYGLMSLFPTLLLALSLLGLLGQYPQTYDAIIGYLRGVVPHSVLVPLDASLRSALQSKGSAVTALVISVALAFYGTTGVLEAARRALNVVFKVESGRSFLRRKAIDVASTVALLALVLGSLVLIFVGGGFARDLIGFAGLGTTVADVWSLVRWPTGVAMAMLVFAFVYYVTPDLEERSFRLVTPGAAVGVVLWLAVSAGFSLYVSKAANLSIYGTFAGVIVLVGWLWLTNVALLIGAELNAAIEHDKNGERMDAWPAAVGKP